MRRTIQIIAMSLPVGISCGGFCIRQSLLDEPDFYQLALAEPAIQLARAERDLDETLRELGRDINKFERWETSFSDAHINAWLAAELVREFPGVLPAEARGPRIQILDDAVQFACQIQTTGTSSIFSVSLKPELTGRANEIRITLQGARIGAFPVPIRPYLSHISRAAKRSKIALTWATDTGQISALVRVPKRKNLRPGVVVERLSLSPGKISLSGRSLPAASGIALAYHPTGSG